MKSVIFAYILLGVVTATFAKTSASPTSSKISRPVIVCLGDSITEGYGVNKNEAFPALIEKKLGEQHPGIRVINAGITGSTSASGPERLAWQLKSKPNLVLLELGANDGLRGQDPKATKANLAKMVKMVKHAKIKVALFTIELPPNYGGKYRKEFSSIFSELAKEEKIPLIPFPHEFYNDRSMLQADGLHPNAAGHRFIADKILTLVRDLL